MDETYALPGVIVEMMGRGVNAKEAIYMLLAERLNKNPVGTPINDTLMEILHRFYTESEAMVGSKFPMFPMTLDNLAGITGMKEEDLQKTLNSMVHKGLVLALPLRDGFYYMLNPMVVGFFEFTFMRVPDFVNTKELAELFDKYLENPEVRKELYGSDTSLFRTLVYENVIPFAVQTKVLNYEKASEIIRQAGYWALGLCTCRHKASHLGKACEAKMPIESETLLGDMARLAVHLGWAREITMDETLQLLDQAEKLGLVHIADNILNQPAFICNCCSCCCELLDTIKRFGISSTHSSNFIPALDTDSCIGCGACADKCPIEVIVLRDAGSGVEVPEVNKQLCLGCGVCASVCSSGALTMSRRTVLHVPPEDRNEQFTRIANERGKI